MLNNLRNAIANKLATENIKAMEAQEDAFKKIVSNNMPLTNNTNTEEKESVFTTKLGDLAKAAANKSKSAGSKVANMSMADIARSTKDGAVLVGSKTGEFKEGFKKGREAARLNKLIEDLTNQYESSSKTEKAKITRTLKVLNAQLEALRNEA